LQREPYLIDILLLAEKKIQQLYRAIFNPNFELEVSNFWKFNTLHDNGAFGGVHPRIYANLIYYFTDPGDSVLDPMAGTGLLAHGWGRTGSIANNTKRSSRANAMRS
jgi:hypothetical protein